MEKFYTCEEVADRYAIQVSTVWEWIKRGELPAVKFGNRYRIRADDLLAYEQRNCTVNAADGDGHE